MLLLARQSAAGDATIWRLARAELQLTRTNEELSRLARGLHPPQLAEQGLAAALASLADDFPLQVDLAVSVTGTSPTVGACVYFVCSEALANVAKPASASSASISVTRRAGEITAEIPPAGTGGADPGKGPGSPALAP